MIRLIVHSGAYAGRDIVTAASLIRVGRDPAKNDLVLADDDQVSARHGLIQRSPRGTYVFEDLGSTNGTAINGRQILNVGRPTAVYLASGDRFRVGHTEIEIADGKARLMVVAGPRTGRELALDDRLLTIGRAPDNLLELDDAEVSAYHAVVRSGPLGFVLEDQGSTNGSLVNDVRVSSHPLTDGDEIAIGTSRLRFMVDDLDARAAAGDDATSGDSSARLVVVGGPGAGRTLALGAGQAVLGRRRDAALQVDDDLVSTMHCAVTRDGERYVLTDLRSRNGTFLNGKRLAHGTPLAPGDLIALGDTVVEFQVTGGGGGGAAPSAMATLMADGAYQLASQPKFVVAGHVVAAPRVTIGEAPSCDLRLEGAGVAREHCRIVWQDGFVLEDLSSTGTYVGDRRVVRERLAAAQVVRVGDSLIDVAVRGERCTLDPIDAPQALAAIEVARDAASALRQGNLTPVDAAAASSRFGALGGGYRTVFQLPVADTDALVLERKQKFRKGAPAWRPSSDIARDRLGAIAVSSAVAAALAVAALLVFSGDAGALVNHPLGAAHASRAFAAEAEARGLGAGCASCHTAGSGVDQGKCTACHAGFAGQLRGGHAGHGDAIAGCVTCHVEHRGESRALAGAPSHLGATSRCADGACHPDQHAAEFLRDGPPPPQVVPAGPVPDFRMAQREFHVAHAMVEPVGQGGAPGASIAIGCTACHAAAASPSASPSASTVAPALVEAVAGKSCFRCHQGGEEHVARQCSACHDDEHRGVAALVRRPPGDPALAPAAAPPTSLGSLARGGLLGLAAFAPLALIAALRRARRRQHSAVAVEALRAHPAELVKRLIHSINMDKCVGCAMCVQACPASVLELVDHKSQVVNFDACIQCKKCEEACAFDALRMHDADKPPPMIQMPEVDPSYQTAVEGMYLIGQASGTPQVKNASNLGRVVVEHAAAGGFSPGGGRAVGAEYDFVIVGSGPAGLSAGLTCAERGYSYVVLEKERDFSWTIRNYYHKGKPVMAEPDEVDLIGPLPHWDTTREQLLAAWSELIATRRLALRREVDVTSVTRDGARFRVAVTDRIGAALPELTAGRVVLAIGTMGNPRKLGCPGEDLEKVKNALVDPDEWRGKDVLVVGGTDSAIEVVLALCEHNRVWMSARGARFDRVKPKNLKLIEAAIAAGRCTPMWATAVAEVTATGVVLAHKSDGRKETLPNDVVFAMIGGHPPIKWLQSIGVGYVDKPHSWSPPRTDGKDQTARAAR